MVDWRTGFAHAFPNSFYARPTPDVAQGLIGAILVRHRRDGGFRAARIVETEAYIAGDPANHAFRGLTRRNWTMFAGPGHLYVYRIHQVHCANVTTAPGEAVLLRAALPLTDPGDRMGGPGLLCRAFSLTVEDDGYDVVRGPVRILPGAEKPDGITATRRIGISQGQELLLRFMDARKTRGARPGKFTRTGP